MPLIEPTCPDCQRLIPLDDVNVSTDVALCRACGKMHGLSQLAVAHRRREDLPAVPDGLTYESTSGGFFVEASTRHPMAFFLIPFSAVWIGGSMYSLFGRQIENGTFNPQTSFFGLPFILGSIMLASMCAMSVAGSVRLSRQSNELVIFTGVGPIGWRRRFDWSGFRSVNERAPTGRGSWGGGSGYGSQIVLEGATRAVFGSMLNEERRYFILRLLERELPGIRR